MGKNISQVHFVHHIHLNRGNLGQTAKRGLENPDFVAVMAESAETKIARDTWQPG
jgi:hypothetical protein